MAWNAAHGEGVQAMVLLRAAPSTLLAVRLMRGEMEMPAASSTDAVQRLQVCKAL